MGKVPNFLCRRYSLPPVVVWRGIQRRYGDSAFQPECEYHRYESHQPLGGQADDDLEKRRDPGYSAFESGRFAVMIHDPEAENEIQDLGEVDASHRCEKNR